MNTLGYAILSAINRKPCSGYELAQYLEAVWPAKHSQIYPLLTKMEQKGFVAFQHVEQTGKPDKKIFSITEEGRKILQNWVKESPTSPIVRDEFLIKIYSIWLLDKEGANQLIQDRISDLERKVTLRANKIEEMERKYGKDELNITSKQFGRYVILHRQIRMAEEEIEWCKWVMMILEK